MDSHLLQCAQGHQFTAYAPALTAFHQELYHLTCPICQDARVHLVPQFSVSNPQKSDEMIMLTNYDGQHIMDRVLLYLEHHGKQAISPREEAVIHWLMKQIARLNFEPQNDTLNFVRHFVNTELENEQIGPHILITNLLQ